MNTKKPNVLMSVVYRHPIIGLDEINDSYLNPLYARSKIQKGNKPVSPFGGYCEFFKTEAVAQRCSVKKVILKNS